MPGIISEEEETMIAERARKRPWRSHPDCPVCQGREDMRDVAADLQYAPGMTRLEMVLHGRYELTEIQTLNLPISWEDHALVPRIHHARLCPGHERNIFAGRVPDPAVSVHLPVHCLLGSSPDPPRASGARPVESIIMPGRFLVFGDANRRPVLRSTLPVAHIRTTAIHTEP